MKSRFTIFSYLFLINYIAKINQKIRMISKGLKKTFFIYIYIIMKTSLKCILRTFLKGF